MLNEIERKETEQAVRAAELALQHLDEADGYLTEALNWGIADLMGGGIIISSVKRRKMEEARHAITTAKRSLNRLARSLGKNKYQFELQLEINNLSDTLDLFLDNTISDLIVQNKLKKVREDVRSVIRDVEDVLGVLLEELAE